ncbi:MAG: lysophospholipid acyltransferase family protein [Clostridia bacterium]|nr:lysophospholipid acyltransferase family protein [Clostridia bacterium]
MLYGFVKLVMKAFLRAFHGFRATGQENVPMDGALIVVANHASMLDAPALGCAFPRQILFMAKAELFRNPFSRALLMAVHAFPVKRGQVDREAYRRSMEILKEGKVLGIFPEGTRSKTGDMQQAHPGAARFALQTGTPVVPAAIVGAHKGHKRLYGKAGRFGVRVAIGKPMWPVRSEDGRVTREEIDDFAQRIMEQIQRLMSVA